ncbi:hypothetical protein RLOatenuis_4860 [Rickettsiales bacterium]|nr:hypothetical protein RLOatenuis_4860 [Rickettsiales bacterium]
MPPPLTKKTFKTKEVLEKPTVKPTQPVIKKELKSNPPRPTTTAVGPKTKVVPVATPTKVVHTTAVGPKTKVVPVVPVAKVTAGPPAWIFFAVAADFAVVLGLYFLLAAVILVSPVISFFIALFAFIGLTGAIVYVYSHSDEKGSSKDNNNQSRETHLRQDKTVKDEQDKTVKKMDCEEQTTSCTEAKPNNEMGEAESEETKITEEIEYGVA